MEESDLEPVYIGNGVTVLAHKKKFCKGPCPIHAPSAHHMVAWPLHWRDDEKIFERICEHGVGHPDPDVMEYIKKEHPEYYEMQGVHGCDGCCVQKHNDN